MTKALSRFLMSALVFAQMLSCKGEPRTKTTETIPIRVRAARVQQGDIMDYLTFNGVTLYQKKENIRANVTGYISWLPFKLGSNIRAGQTFATVRTKEQDALAEAIKIDSTLAKLSGPISIASNGTGVITVLNVQKNDYVAEGDILATIAQPKSLVVQVNVPYEYEDDIDIGTSCEIILQNEKSIMAKISAVLPVMDAVPQSQQFLIELPNEDLPENLNVQVKTLYREHKNVLTVPLSALQTNELLTDFWVLKIQEDSLAIKERVGIGLRNDSLVEIVSGNLRLRDWVVTEGSYQMQDSTKVSVDTP